MFNEQSEDDLALPLGTGSGTSEAVGFNHRDSSSSGDRIQRTL